MRSSDETFPEELENECSRITYLVADFYESKDKWYKVSYEICVNFMLCIVVPFLKLRGSFVNIFCASYGAIMLHIYQNLIYYRDGD